MTKKIKNHVGLSVEKNSFEVTEEGVVEFQNGLTITDNTVQRNGTTYHVDSLGLDEFKGQVTADHVDKLENVIAQVEGVKRKGNKVIVNKIRYALDINPLARLAYNLFINGFSTDFSIETYGPEPGSDGVYYNHALIGLSQVVVGNNKNANAKKLNTLVKNSIDQSREDGLDISELDEILEEIRALLIEKSEKQTPKDNESEDEYSGEIPEEVDFEEELNVEDELEKESEDEESEEEVVVIGGDAAAAEIDEEETEQGTPEEETKDDEGNDEESEDEEEDDKKKTNKKEINRMTFVTIKNSRKFAVDVTYKNAAGEQVEATIEPGKSVDVSEDQKVAVEEAIASADAPQVDVEAKVAEAVNAVTKKFENQFAEFKKKFDESAEEPAFTATATAAKTKNGFADLNYRERHAKQINSAFEALRLQNAASAKTLNEINQVNLDALKQAGKVANAITIADFGNFVISPELLTEIEGTRTDYSDLVSRTEWIETLSLQFAWTKRSGDINMQNVELCDDGADGNLKPISEYGTEQVISDLEEIAAVTPVCNAATRFLAVDLLGDVARGYQTDYDRKRAELVIGRLQQAVDANTDNSIDNTATSSVGSLSSFVSLWAKLGERTMNGVYLFSHSTFAAIQQLALEVGSNGPLSQVFMTGEVPTIFGKPYILVPNDLMPALGSGETRTVVVDKTAVEINHAVFYFDLRNFTGRVSGGLQYDLSTDASYEVGGVVRSAYQRNEIVLRGSFFRGGAIKDDTKVSGLKAEVAQEADGEETP